MSVSMHRRDFMRWAAAGLAVMSMPRPVFSGHVGARGPNVLLIIIDDLNDWVGCLGGHPQAETPNIDRLAARGVLFANAHCSAPLCGPSRTSLMTGVLPCTSGLVKTTRDWRANPVLAAAVTIPEHFMGDGGYVAYRVGKVFHLREAELWQKAGFDGNGPAYGPGPFVTGKTRGRRAHGTTRIEFNWGPLERGVAWRRFMGSRNARYSYVDDGTRDPLADELAAAWVARRLKKKHSAPFLLAVGFHKPHGPWHVPQQYFERFPADEIALPSVKADDLGDVPELGRRRGSVTADVRTREVRQWKEAVRAYLACISFVDEQVGKVLRALDASPCRDDTIVVLLSDNGLHLGQKQHWMKQTLWEEATRVPLVIAAPAVTAPGGVCTRAVSLVDVYPTLTDLCGLAPDPNKRGNGVPLDGNSLVPLLRDPEAQWDHLVLTSCPDRRWPKYTHHSIRTERWRYIRYADGSEELYDHDNDPLEWANLAGDTQYAVTKEELADRMRETLTASRLRRESAQRKGQPD